MSALTVDLHRDTLIDGLKLIYSEEHVTFAGAKVSNGRGGFITSSADRLSAYVQREMSAAELAKRNVAPDKAMIYVLNTLGRDVTEGALIEFSGRKYRAVKVGLDPVGAVFECVCDGLK